ncbi:hypothetical protein ACPA54_16185 [Uniformispora flossi]|uniref:hypothetical protein n=1 Tax=Uniformispora flossi TaxID=3390723 RepID=UPI003C2EAAA1
MGFDTSFHPVDLDIVQERVLPYIAGQGDDGSLDDLADHAVRLRRVRFDAKQWALGAIDAADELGVSAFDTRLHVWGRPFFIVADEPDDVVEAYMRYADATADDVPAIARDMLGRLSPALADAVKPSTDGTLPGEAALKAELTWRLRLLRACGKALRSGGGTVRDPDTGREHDPAELMRREVPFSVLEFAAAIDPGWMSRGYSWPTRVCEAAEVDAGAFDVPLPLFAPLARVFPDLRWFGAPTIVENYMVGGLVRPEAVRETRALLAARRAELLAPAEADGWGAGLAVDLRKVDEAFAYAEARGFAFCEATEIYSGFGGSLN